jgi:hypothetical protein
MLIIFLIQLQSFVWAQNIRCPIDGIGSQKGDQPSLLSKMKNGHLMICGFKEEQDNKTVYSEFDVYAEVNGKYSKSLFRANALDNYYIETREGGLNLIELVFIKGALKPIAMKTMSCLKGGNCTLTKASCIPLKKDIKSDILKKIKPYFSNKKFVPDVMIGELGDLALMGDSEARKIFENNPGMKLDGASAEEYNQIKNLIKTHPCFK